MKKLFNIKFEEGIKCDLCGSDIFVSTPYSMRYMLLLNSQKIHVKSCESHPDNITFLQHENGTRICLICFEVLVGMENYFDMFFPEIIENHLNQAQKLCQIVRTDKKIGDQIITYRKTGGYIPDAIINKFIEVKS